MSEESMEEGAGNLELGVMSTEQRYNQLPNKRLHRKVLFIAGFFGYRLNLRLKHGHPETNSG